MHEKRTWFLGRTRSRLAVQAAGFAAGLLYGLVLGAGALLALMTGDGVTLYYLIGISPFLAGPFIWPVIGALAPVARTRTAFLVVLALLAAHYAGAALLIANYGAEAFVGLARAPIGLHLLALVLYAGGQAAVWALLAWRYRRARWSAGARRPAPLTAAAVVAVAVLAMVAVASVLPRPLKERQQRALEAAAGVPLQRLEPGMEAVRRLPADRPPLSLVVDRADPSESGDREGPLQAPHPAGGVVEAHVALAASPLPATPIVTVVRPGTDGAGLTFPGGVSGVRGDPVALAVAPDGNVNLMVADADPAADAGLELYWATGSVESGRWSELWQVERGGPAVSRVELDAAALGASVHLVWSERRVDAVGSGLYHLERGETGFTVPLRLLDEAPDEVALAPGPAEGDLWVAYADGAEIYLMLRRPDGRWSRSMRIGTAAARVTGLSLERFAGGLEVQARGQAPAAWRVRLADREST